MNDRTASDRGRAERDTTEIGRGRRFVIRGLAVLGLFTASLFPVFATTDALSRVGQDQVLEAAGSPEAQYGADHPSESIHIPASTAMAAIVASGLIGLIVWPSRAGFATHTGAVGIAMLSVAGVIGDPDNYGGQGLPVDPAVLVLALPVLAAAAVAAPWREWRKGGLKHPQFLILAALALPALWFGVDQGLLQRNTWPPLADPHHQGHWMMMAQLAFAIPLATVGSAVSGRGWRPAATTAAIGALAIGVASLVDSQAGSALPMAWAIAATGWAVMVLTFTWAKSRRRHESEEAEGSDHGASVF